MSLLDESGNLSQANYYKVDSAIRDRLFTELFSFSWFTEQTTFITTRSQLITPQSIMEVGKTIFLFKIDDSSLELFHKKLNELPPSISQSLRKNFAARAYDLPIDMRYCSMSGKYCFSAIHEPGEKKPCALKG